MQKIKTKAEKYKTRKPEEEERKLIHISRVLINLPSIDSLTMQDIFRENSCARMWNNLRENDLI